MSTKTTTQQTKNKSKSPGNFIMVDKDERSATHYISFTDGSHVKLNNNKLAILHTMLDDKAAFEEYRATQEQIAVKCNVSKRLVEETIKEFEQHGVLVILRRKSPSGWSQNVYTQVNKPAFVVPAEYKELKTKPSSKPALDVPGKASSSPVYARSYQGATHPQGMQHYDEIEPPTEPAKPRVIAVIDTELVKSYSTNDDDEDEFQRPVLRGLAGQIMGRNKHKAPEGHAIKKTPQPSFDDDDWAF